MTFLGENLSLDPRDLGVLGDSDHLVRVSHPRVVFAEQEPLVRGHSVRRAGVFHARRVRCARRGASQGSAFSWVSIFANVRQVGDVLFRMPPRHDTHPLVSAAVIVLIIAASAFVLRRRIRAIEVVT